MLFRASGGLTFLGNMNEDVGCATLHGVSLLLGILKPLVEIPGLSDIEGNPAAVFRLFGVNIIARHQLERSLERINLIWIFLARLAGPIDMGISFSTPCTPCFVATT